MTVPDVAPVVDAAVLSPAVDFLADAASFFTPGEWVALAVALAVVAALVPGAWRDALRQDREQSARGVSR